jgi:competence protein ComEC
MKRVICTTACVLLLAATASARDLEIYFIDVEGGQSTLIVTPAGKSVLVDAGYGGARGPRDSDRILAVLHEAGVDRINYMLVTHFHPDHLGGLPAVAERVPIDMFIDYGEPMGTDRMALGVFRAYEPIRATRPHLHPNAGDFLPLEDVEVQILSEGGTLIQKPLPGAGQHNPACEMVEDYVDDGTENFRSIGFRLRLGAFRFVDLGDLSGNTLTSLACPVDLLGPASVYLVAHHGNYDSNVPALLAALRPQASILNNGPIKGGVRDSLATLLAQPDMDLWQLHESRNRDAQNAPDEFIANVDDGATSYWLKLTAKDDGSFELLNPRTGFVKRYAARKTTHNSQLTTHN